MLSHNVLYMFRCLPGFDHAPGSNTIEGKDFFVIVEAVRIYDRLMIPIIII
jgi:hypothetical protein